MPAGIPVGTLAIGKAGAKNAGLLAAAILATGDAALAERLKAWRAAQTAGGRDRSRMSVLPPGSTIGILGGGQLGRMLAVAAAQLGYRTQVLRARWRERRGADRLQLHPRRLSQPHRRSTSFAALAPMS